MTTDSERFKEIFRKQAAIPNSAPVETVTDQVVAKHLQLSAKHPLLKKLRPAQPPLSSSASAMPPKRHP
jgi:hypothetical protein